MDADKVYSLAYNLLKLNVINAYSDVEESDDKEWELINKVTNNPDAYVDFMLPGIPECAELLRMAKADMAAKKVTKSVVRGMNNIYKAAAAYGKEAYKGAWYDEQGRQCLCDGYRLVRLNTPVENIPNAPDDPNRASADKLMGAAHEYTKPLKLPNIKDLRQHIVEEQAKRRVERYRKDERITYDFGEGLPLVDAQLLMDMLNIFDIAEATWEKLCAPIYFHSEAGDGLLLPVLKR